MYRSLIRNMVTGEWREPGTRYNTGVTPTETEWRKIHMLDLTPRKTSLPCGSEHVEWGVDSHTGEQEELYTLYT